MLCAHVFVQISKGHKLLANICVYLRDTSTMSLKIKVKISNGLEFEQYTLRVYKDENDGK